MKPVKENIKNKYFMSTHGPIKGSQEVYKNINGRLTYSSLNTTMGSITDKIHDELISRALKRSKETNKVLQGSRR